MSTAEERRKILEMVAAGKLGAGEAADLLSGPTASEVEPAAPERPPVVAEAPAKAEASAEAEVPAEVELPAEAEAPARMEDPSTGKAGASATGGPRWLKVRVGDLESGRRKVTVNIPLSLMKFGLQVGRGFAPGLQDVDWEELNATLAEGEGGLLVDVKDEEDGEHVQVYVE